jgi:hypothetical protein
MDRRHDRPMDGYLEFQRRPQAMLDWFAQCLS